MFRIYAAYLAAPAIDTEGERYGIQSATCYRCLNNFCDDDDGTCQDDLDKWFSPCMSCAKNFCNRCEPITYCEKCDTSFCEYCSDWTYCDVDGCNQGPFCDDCADEETRLVYFPRERIAECAEEETKFSPWGKRVYCNECFNRYDCGGSDVSHDSY